MDDLSLFWSDDSTLKCIGTMRQYCEKKVEVIGFASPRIGKVLKFRGHEVSEEF